MNFAAVNGPLVVNVKHFLMNLSDAAGAIQPDTVRLTMLPVTGSKEITNLRAPFCSACEIKATPSDLFTTESPAFIYYLISIILSGFVAS